MRDGRRPAARIGRMRIVATGPQRRILSAGFVALASLLPGCGCGPTDASKDATAAASGGNAIQFDRAAQKLDPALNDAYRAVQGKQYAAARAAVEGYLARAGSGARRGQAEFLIGLSYHEAELYAESEPHFARAVELEPAYLATYYYRGFDLYQVGRLAEARAALETHLRAQPDGAETLFVLGLVALEEDRADEALSRIRRAIELTEPRLSDASAGPARQADARRDLGRYLARLADAQMRKEDFAGARASLERSVALVPDIPDVWSKLHHVLVRLGDDKAAAQALAHYEETAARRAKSPR
jgi:tetratricopeptide (TPR) repeat protein